MLGEGHDNDETIIGYISVPKTLRFHAFSLSTLECQRLQIHPPGREYLKISVFGGQKHSFSMDRRPKWRKAMFLNVFLCIWTSVDMATLVSIE